MCESVRVTLVTYESLRRRLERIAGAHSKWVDEHGGTYGTCGECDHSWPCPTYVWATEGRDPLMCWDPADDAEADDLP